ncbi:acyltransferase [Salinarimonas soli]|nr:acyltransferase family protein [Salinarimonas soli]
MSHRIVGIDAFRVPAVLAVILIHSTPTGQTEIGAPQIMNQISRFAVPFFFVLSGYFIGLRGIDSASSTFYRVARRTLPVFIVWTSLYAIVAPGGIERTLKVGTLIYTIITGGPFGYHLWFLPSLIVCTAMATWLVTNFRWFYAIIFALMLYVVGLCLSSYSGLFTGYGIWSKGIWVARATPLIGTIYVISGIYLGVHGARSDIRLWAALLASGISIHLCESWALSRVGLSQFTASEFLIGTLGSGIGAFGFAANLQKTRTLEVAAKIGRYGLGMYCVHLFFVNFLYEEQLQQNFCLYAWKSILAFVGSALVAILISRVRMLRRFVE